MLNGKGVRNIIASFFDHSRVKRRYLQALSNVAERLGTSIRSFSSSVSNNEHPIYGCVNFVSKNVAHFDNFSVVNSRNIFRRVVPAVDINSVIVYFASFNRLSAQNAIIH